MGSTRWGSSRGMKHLSTKCFTAYSLFGIEITRFFPWFWLAWVQIISKLCLTINLSWHYCHVSIHLSYFFNQTVHCNGSPMSQSPTQLGCSWNFLMEQSSTEASCSCSHPVASRHVLKCTTRQKDIDEMQGNHYETFISVC